MALIALIGGLASACGSDTTRFSESSFSNPFAGGEPPATGSLPANDLAPMAEPMPRQSIQSAPLAAPSLSAPRPVASVGPAPTQTGAGGWTAQGGSTVTVNQGQSLASLSNLYGVPPAAILKANNLANAGQVTAGKRITIPVYSASGSGQASAPSAPRQAAAASRTVAAPVAAANREPSRLRFVEGAKPAAQSKEINARTRPGQTRAPEPVRLAEKPAEPKKLAKAEPPQAKVKPETKAEAKTVPAKPERVASIAPTASVTSKQAAQPEPARPAAKEPEATGALSPSAEFRWPARGRVISGFGGSAGNEGINIAVPDGTPVKAAEAGTVAYSGSEVKGYGNLVLIRHDNGFVSAYAHNGELSVKRGDKVKRGQVVAKSGQSGNVTSPQIHFEIRKGSTPVDPTPYLSASN